MQIERLERELQTSCNPETGCTTDAVDTLLTQSRDGEITFRETKRLVRQAIGMVISRG